MAEQAVSLDEDLRRIEAAVADGRTDLAALGFWKAVARVKRDPSPERWADTAGRIDRLAFERRIRLRIPVWLGTTILLGATVVLVALVPVAIALAGASACQPGPGALCARSFGSASGAAGILLVVAAVGLAGSVHGPAHWVAGRAGGIRFLAWFLDGPLRIQPGLKIDYASYLRAEPRARATMHAAGALATKAAPFAVFAPAYIAHARAGWELLPEWSLWAVLGIGVLQVVTDVIWSTKRSDWKKVRRERRVARDREAAGMAGGIMAPESRPGSSGQPG